MLAAKAQLKQIHSLHIYSLGPSKVQVSQRSLALVSTILIVTESPYSIRLQQSNIREIRERGSISISSAAWGHS